MSIMSSIDSIVGKLQQAQRENRDLQSKTAVGSPEWRLHETIDDLLHESLAALGQ